MSNLQRGVAVLAIAAVAASLTMTATAGATAPGDNGRIAYRTYLDADRSTSAIFVLRPGGPGPRQVTHPRKGTADSQPDWSPRGNLIGFERCAPNTVCAIYTVRPDGTRTTRLTAPCHARPPALETRCADESGIAFMPGGGRVVFTRATGRVRSFPGGDSFIEHSDLVVRDLSGRHIHVVLRGRPFTGDNSQAVASPDGNRLAFQRVNSPIGRPAGGAAVFVVNLDGRHLRRITPWSLNAGDHPDWSPDGKWILFRSVEGGDFLNSQLYVVHPDGTGMRQITHQPADAMLLSASFSPDGRRIVYSRSGRGGMPDIFTLNVNGGGRRQLTRTPAWDSAPDWGPQRSGRS
jgi:TolB protein